MVKLLILIALLAAPLWMPANSNKVFAQAQKNAKVSAPKLSNKVLKDLGFAKVKFEKVDNNTWKLDNGITVYSTHPYGKDVRGFLGSTPLFIAVDGSQKIVSMVAAQNMETPEYFVLTKPLLKFWNGKTLTQAKTAAPDAITGATLSSKAIVKTVHNTAAALTK